MPEDWKLFLSKQFVKRHPKDVCVAMSQATSDVFKGIETKEVLGLRPGRENQFLLETSTGLILGHVFMSFPTSEEWNIFCRESEAFDGWFKRPLSHCIYIPSVFEDASYDVNWLPTMAETYQRGKIRFFEYSFVKTDGQELVSLREWAPRSQQMGAVQSIHFQPRREPEYSFFRQTRLNSSELAELLDLTLELNQIC